MGDESSQYRFYRYCFDLLMPVCMRYKSNETDAVSALNLAFIKLINKYDSKQPQIAFDHWAKRIMINQLIDEYRKDKKRLEVHQSVEPGTLSSYSGGYQFNSGEEKLKAEVIIKAIGHLEEPARTIFNLHAIEGFSHKEIANQLRISVENSRYHLHMARKNLKHILNQHLKLTKPA